MHPFLKITEAASLALHTMGLMAADPERTFSNKDIALRLGASEAHLAKVMQRLVKAGLIRSRRGPKGGFTLAGDPDEISLLQVYQAAEGPIEEITCLLDKRICIGECILGGLLERLNQEIGDYLRHTSLGRIRNTYHCQGCEVKNGRNT